MRASDNEPRYQQTAASRVLRHLYTLPNMSRTAGNGWPYVFKGAIPGMWCFELRMVRIAQVNLEFLDPQNEVLVKFVQCFSLELVADFWSAIRIKKWESKILGNIFVRGFRATVGQKCAQNEVFQGFLSYVERYQLYPRRSI